MRESYPQPDQRSTPGPPPLPGRPSDRLQFGLAQLLGYMVFAAIVAWGIRQLLQLTKGLPDASRALGLPPGRVPFWTDLIVYSLVGAAALYVLLRGPWLLLHAWRFQQRWRGLQAHRRALAEWSAGRRGQARDDRE